MSAFKTVTLNCDGVYGDHSRNRFGELEGAWFETGSGSIPDVRRAARAMGWVTAVRGGKDFCPAHVNEPLL